MNRIARMIKAREDLRKEYPEAAELLEGLERQVAQLRSDHEEAVIAIDRKIVGLRTLIESLPK